MLFLFVVIIFVIISFLTLFHWIPFSLTMAPKHVVALVLVTVDVAVVNQCVVPLVVVAEDVVVAADVVAVCDDRCFKRTVKGGIQFAMV